MRLMKNELDKTEHNTHISGSHFNTGFATYNSRLEPQGTSLYTCTSKVCTLVSKILHDKSWNLPLATSQGKPNQNVQ